MCEVFVRMINVSIAIHINLSLHNLSPTTNLILELSKLLGLLEDVINTSLHVEGNLRQVVELS